MFSKKQERTAIEVGEKLKEMARPIPRPFVEAIDADLARKLHEYNNLATEIAELRTFREFLEMHREADAMVTYFLKAAGSKP